MFAALLAQPASWRYGYDLMKETGLASGTLYPLLARLHEAGILEAEWRPAPKLGRPPRHVYRLTQAGVVAAREAVQLRIYADGPGRAST